jgi:hypothetical protein
MAIADGLRLKKLPVMFHHNSRVMVEVDLSSFSRLFEGFFEARKTGQETRSGTKKIAE